MVVKRFLTVAICSMLFVSLLGANVTLALDRGALNGEYVKGAADEAGLYGAVRAEAVAAIGEETSGVEELPVDVDVRTLLSEAVTPEYVRGQAEANIDRLYAFLHGEGDLEIVLDLRPVKESVADTLVEEIADTPVEEFGIEGDAAERLSNLLESEDSYEAEREAFRERVKEALRQETGVDPEDDFGSDLLANLSESEESYEAEREAFREEKKQEIQDSTERKLSEEELERAYEEGVDEYREELRDEYKAELLGDDVPEPLAEPADDLIDLVVDALTTDRSHAEFDEEYAAVTADFDDGLDALIDERSGELRDELREEIETELAADDLPEPLRESALEMVDLVVDAMTDDVTYETFAAEFEAIKVSMAEDAVAHFLDEDRGGVPDTIDVTEEMDDQAADDLEPVREAISIVGLLATLLPVVSIGLVGGLYGVVREVDAVAIGVGAVAVVAGGISAAVTRLVPDRLFADLDVDVSPELAEAIEAFVRALFAPLWSQSLVLLGVGAVLLGAGLAIRFDLVSPPNR